MKNKTERVFVKSVEKPDYSAVEDLIRQTVGENILWSAQA